MNWLLSEDGFKTVTYGVPDTDWTEDASGKVTFHYGNKADGTAYVNASAKYPFTGMNMLAAWSGFRSYMNQAISEGVLAACDEYTKTIEAENPEQMKVPNVKGLTLEDSSTYDVLDYNETINKFMTATGNIDDFWASFKADQLKKGYDQVINEMNTLYDARK